MSEQWQITYMDGTEELIPEYVQLELDSTGSVWIATGAESSSGRRRFKAMYPVVNIRRMERVR